MFFKFVNDFVATKMTLKLIKLRVSNKNVIYYHFHIALNINTSESKSKLHCSIQDKATKVTLRDLLTHFYLYQKFDAISNYT